MPKPLEIKRIDLLVHPFSGASSQYSKKRSRFLLTLWKEHIDEAAKDRNRLLLVTPISGVNLDKKKLNKSLLRYAKKKLGRRFGFFEQQAEPFIPFRNRRGEGFYNFADFAKADGFIVDPKTVKTRGLGEFTNQCVGTFLTKLNFRVGLENIIPYRNRQSTILARKSISGRKYPMPWQLKKLLKTAEGKEKLKKLMQTYIIARRKKANALAKFYKYELFKPRQWKKPR